MAALGRPSCLTARMATTADVRDLLDYLAASPSPFHAVAEASARLRAAGFRALDERAHWDDVTGSCYVVRDGALVAWRCPPATPPDGPLRIVGAHTDSPNLRLKPQPDTDAFGWR